jgi:hypothetical protein
MPRPNARRLIALGAITAGISVGAIAAPVFAQAASGSTSTTTNSTTAPSTTTPACGRGFGGNRSAYDAAVAAHLGITTQKFEAAEQALRGTMTPPTRGATQTSRAAAQAAFDAALSSKLGVSASQLTTAEDAANQQIILKNLSTLVARGALTQAQATALRQAATKGTFDQVLRAQEIARLTTRLHAAVAAGRITQAQATQMLTNAQTAPHTGPGLGLGFGGGMHGMGPGGAGGPMDHGGAGFASPGGAPGNGGALQSPI